MDSFSYIDFDVNESGKKCSFNYLEDQEYKFCSIYSAFDQSKMQDGTFYYSQVSVKHERHESVRFTNEMVVDITFKASVESEDLSAFQ